MTSGWSARCAGTAGGQTLTLHWDGRAWQRVPSPNPGARDNRLYAVSATAGGVWAVGEAVDAAGRDQTLILRWDGTHWQQQASPSPGAQTNQLLAVTGRTPSDAWAGGTDGQTLVEHWDGRAWRVVPSPNSGPAGDRILGLAVAPNGDLWAVGSGTAGALALRYQPALPLPTPP